MKNFALIKMYKNNTGYSTSELISRVYTGCLLPLNFPPKNLYIEENQEKIDIFFSIASFNSILFLIKGGIVDKNIFVSELKFPENFKNAIKNPTLKTEKAADFYPTWFQMCCHLKILFKNDLDEGLKYFKLFSALSKKYNEKECEKFWENCSPKFGSIPGVFSLIDKYIFPEPELNRKQIIKKSFYSGEKS